MDENAEVKAKELAELVDPVEMYELDITGKFRDGTSVALLQLTGQELLNLKALVKS